LLQVFITSLFRLNKQFYNESKEFVFMPLLLRSLYTLNKIDKAIVLFDDPDFRKNLMMDLSCSIVVLDYLIENKQYDALIEFYDKHLVGNDLIKIPSSFINAFTLSLFKKVINFDNVLILIYQSFLFVRTIEQLLKD
jgi:hypothetical protein